MFDGFTEHEPVDGHVEVDASGPGLGDGLHGSGALIGIEHRRVIVQAVGRGGWDGGQFSRGGSHGHEPAQGEQGQGHHPTR